MAGTKKTYVDDGQGQPSHYDVVYTRETVGEYGSVDKVHLTLGRAFPNEKGRIRVKLGALPVNTKSDELSFTLFPKWEKK